MRTPGQVMTSMSSAASHPVDDASMRAVLGRFCSGVTVITARTDTEPVGFTCQSFSSLSLTPPLVSFAPARTSTTWPRVRQVGTFCVNILAEQQATVSDAFARSGTDKFVGIEWTDSATGSPALAGSLAWVDCELWAEYDAGDHTIVAAHVLALRTSAVADPLIFHQGRYRLSAPSPGDQR